MNDDKEFEGHLITVKYGKQKLYLKCKIIRKSLHTGESIHGAVMVVAVHLHSVATFLQLFLLIRDIVGSGERAIVYVIGMQKNGAVPRTIGVDEFFVVGASRRVLVAENVL